MDYLRFPGDILLQRPFAAPSAIITSYNKRKLLELKKPDNFYGPLRAFLIFGKIIGLVPLQKLCQPDFTQVVYRKTSISALLSISATLILGVNTLVAIASLGSGAAFKAFDHAWAPAMFTFYASGMFIFIYFHKNIHEFLKIIKKWSSLQLFYTQSDLTLARDVNLIAGIVMTSGILENMLVHLKQFPVVPQTESHVIKFKENPNMTAWQVYYTRSHSQWAGIIPYHMIFSVFVFISNKLALYAWNYMDITIVILARALSFKFKALYRMGEAILIPHDGIEFDTSKWQKFAEEHLILCELLQQINAFISPLIFMSYANNVYFVSLQFNLSLNPSGGRSVLSSIYATWSFLHLIARVYLVSIHGARVNEWAHKVADIYRRCPNDLYITEIERSERFVSSNILGLTGCGCFVITKPLMLKIIGVVFTFEIVLLQASQSSLRNS